MVEIPDIKDKDSLEAWLEDQPREVSIWIASRAAARVLPVWWQAVLTKDWAHQHDLTALPVLRSLLILPVAAFGPFNDLERARDIERAAVGASASSASAASAAASAAAYAASASASAASAAYTREVNAAAYAAYAAADYAAAAFWTAMRADAEQVAGASFPYALLLWPMSAHPLKAEWNGIRRRVKCQSDASDWEFWLDWYDAQIAGRTMLPDPARTWEMLEKITLIDPETWDAGPEVVNPVIREIWENYKGKTPRELEVLQAADDGIVLGYNVETDRLYQEDVEPKNESRLQAAVAKLNEVRLLLGQMGNLQGILTSEMFLIDRAVQDHPENATMVFFNTKAARGLLQANIENGSCPTPKAEPVIGLLDTMLLDTQNTLLPEPAVQEGLTRRAEDSALLDQPGALQTLEDAAEEIAEVSEGALANELPENAEKAKDSFQPRAVRMSALIGTVSAVLQAWIIAGYERYNSVLAEIDDLTARKARIVKNVSIIGAGGCAAVHVLSNSPKVKAAIDAILASF